MRNAISYYHTETIQFFILATAQVALISAITLISMALPKISQEFILTSIELRMLNAAYGLSFGGLLLLGSSAPARYGMFHTFMVGICVWGLASLLCAVSWNFSFLLFSRLLQGAGGAIAAPASILLLKACFPREMQYNKMLATWGVLASLGATIGMIASGFILSVSVWRMGFYCIAILAMLIFAAGAKFLPRPAPSNAGQLPLWRGLLFCAGIMAVTYALLTISKDTSFYTLGMLTAGICIICVFFVIDSKANNTMLPVLLFINPTRLIALSAIFLGSGAMGTFFFATSVWLQTTEGWTPLQLSLAFLPFGGCVFIAALAGGFIIKVIGATSTVLAGLLLAIAGLLFAVWSNGAAGVAGVTAMVLFPLGISFCFSGGTVNFLSGLPAQYNAPAAGCLNIAMELGPATIFALFTLLASLIGSLFTYSNQLIEYYQLVLLIVAITLMVFLLIIGAYYCYAKLQKNGFEQ